MKKLITIICILLVIFLGMLIYKNNQKKDIISLEDVNTIEEYIQKIYMWKEITGEALPKFDNINDASELWTWEVVKKNLEKYELTYEDIQNEAIEIFGENFSKKFPEEGTEYIKYDNERNLYYTTGIGLDMQDDCFFIENIKRTENGYEVKIVEYLEDYENSINAEENSEYDIYVKNLNQETIGTLKNTDSESNVIEIVKNNIDKFTGKTIYLTKNRNNDLYVEKVE